MAAARPFPLNVQLPGTDHEPFLLCIPANTPLDELPAKITATHRSMFPSQPTLAIRYCRNVLHSILSGAVAVSDILPPNDIIVVQLRSKRRKVDSHSPGARKRARLDAADVLSPSPSMRADGIAVSWMSPPPLHFPQPLDHQMPPIPTALTVAESASPALVPPATEAEDGEAHHDSDTQQADVAPDAMALTQSVSLLGLEDETMAEAHQRRNKRHRASTARSAPGRPADCDAAGSDDAGSDDAASEAGKAGKAPLPDFLAAKTRSAAAAAAAAAAASTTRKRKRAAAPTKTAEDARRREEERLAAHATSAADAITPPGVYQAETLQSERGGDESDADTARPQPSTRVQLKPKTRPPRVAGAKTVVAVPPTKGRAKQAAAASSAADTKGRKARVAKPLATKVAQPLAKPPPAAKPAKPAPTTKAAKPAKPAPADSASTPSTPDSQRLADSSDDDDEEGEEEEEESDEEASSSSDGLDTDSDDDDRDGDDDDDQEQEEEVGRANGKGPMAGAKNAANSDDESSPEPAADDSLMDPVPDTNDGDDDDGTSESSTGEEDSSDSEDEEEDEDEESSSEELGAPKPPAGSGKRAASKKQGQAKAVKRAKQPSPTVRKAEAKAPETAPTSGTSSPLSVDAGDFQPTAPTQPAGMEEVETSSSRDMFAPVGTVRSPTALAASHKVTPQRGESGSSGDSSDDSSDDDSSDGDGGGGIFNDIVKDAPAIKEPMRIAPLSRKKEKQRRQSLIGLIGTTPSPKVSARPSPLKASPAGVSPLGTRPLRQRKRRPRSRNTPLRHSDKELIKRGVDSITDVLGDAKRWT